MLEVLLVDRVVTADVQRRTQPRNPKRPSRRSSGQKSVTLDCSRFAPTNAVNRNHAGCTSHPNASDTRMKMPAKRRMMSGSHMGIGVEEVATFGRSGRCHAAMPAVAIVAPAGVTAVTDGRRRHDTRRLAAPQLPVEQ